MLKLKILMIEDNENDVFLIREFLNDYDEYSFESQSIDFELIAKESITHSLLYLESNTPDLILLDLTVTDSLGLESLDKLKDYIFEIPVIILTGMNDHKLGMMSIKLGAQDYLVKGKLDPENFFRSIRYAMERHKISTMLRNLSLTDDLTGLYNRRGFFSLSEHDLRIAKRNKSNVFLTFIDFDRMKFINDTYGHEEGDNALRDTAKILRTSFRDSDIIARIGGDEFLVLSISDEDSETNVIKRFVANLSDFAEKEIRCYDLSLSYGVVMCKAREIKTLDALITEADKKMYINKKAKKNG